MAEAKRDSNRVPTLIGVSSLDLSTPTNVAVDPNTGEVLVQADISLTTWVNTALTLTDANTAYLLPTVEQVGRKSLVVYNISDTAVYFGDALITTTTGILLSAGGILTIDAEKDIYVVCGSSGKILNVLEGR